MMSKHLICRGDRLDEMLFKPFFLVKRPLRNRPQLGHGRRRRQIALRDQSRCPVDDFRFQVRFAEIRIFQKRG